MALSAIKSLSFQSLFIIHCSLFIFHIVHCSLSFAQRPAADAVEADALAVGECLGRGSVIFPAEGRGASRRGGVADLGELSVGAIAVGQVHNGPHLVIPGAAGTEPQMAAGEAVHLLQPAVFLQGSRQQRHRFPCRAIRRRLLF